MGMALLRYVLDPDVVRVLRVVTAEGRTGFPELNKMIEEQAAQGVAPAVERILRKRKSSLAVSNCRTFPLRRHCC